jgi:uncharacterized membrane protein
MVSNDPARTAPETALSRLLPDRMLGALAAVMLAAVVVAVARGHGEWMYVPSVIWLHLGTIAVALALTPVMLLRQKGDGPHRLLGWTWATAIMAAALSSIAIPLIDGRRFSWIWPLSLFVLVQVPRLVMFARAHDVLRHRRTVRGLVIGALLIAGLFTFPFHRLLGHWLLG